MLVSLTLAVASNITSTLFHVLFPPFEQHLYRVGLSCFFPITGFSFQWPVDWRVSLYNYARFISKFSFRVWKITILLLNWIYRRPSMALRTLWCFLFIVYKAYLHCFWLFSLQNYNKKRLNGMQLPRWVTVNRRQKLPCQILQNET